MKKSIITSLIVMMSSIVYANTNKSFIDPLSVYKSNYFISGDKNEDQVKWQMSMKCNLLWPFNSGVYFGYTQLSYWRIYDNKSPFKDSNYQPEFFYKFESGNNLINNINIPFIDYIQVSPYYHRSNGRDGEESRGENKYYVEVQKSFGQSLNIGTRTKIFGYYTVQEGNKDINRYHNNYEMSVFIKNVSKRIRKLEKETIELTWGGNPYDEGWIQLEISTRIITTYVQPKIFFQAYHGYDEFMLNYDTKTTAFRIGVGI